MSLAFSTPLLSDGVVKGFIRDKANGETIPYANIILSGTGKGDVSDETGYYVIVDIPPGNYVIRATMMGYKPRQQNIVISGQTLTIDFHLEQTTLEMEAVVKTAERERFERQIEPSLIQLTPRDIHSLPALVEPDLFRVLQALPGVVAVTDFSSALYIRGGNPSENIILLDGVRIYNPYHLGGVFSVFNADAIKSVDFSAGGFPAKYGNAISSAIAVTNKDGNDTKIEGRGGVSMLSSRLTLEAPIPHGSILLSGRRTYFDALYNTFFRPSIKKAHRFPYYFYDFNGKINYNVSPNSRFTLSSYYGDDILIFENEQTGYNEEIGDLMTEQVKNSIKFGNFTTALKWRYIITPRLYAEIIAASSRFRTRIDSDAKIVADAIDARDVISDRTIKSNMTWFASPKHEIKFGLEWQRLFFDLYFKVGEFEWLAYHDQASRRANFYSVYLQDNWSISPLINLQSGVRATWYDVGPYFRAEPRLSLRWRVLHNVNLKTSCGLYYQYFYTFNPEDFDFIRLVDLWFPIDERYPPIQAIHYNLGTEFWLNDALSFSIEAYYKDYAHLLDLNEFSSPETDRDDFLGGWGYAEGIEFLLRKQRGKLTGMLAYSLARTEHTIQTPRPSALVQKFENDYMTFFPNHDRRHTLTATANYQPNKTLILGCRATFASGLPETPTVGYQLAPRIDETNNRIYNSEIPVKAPKNSERLPNYFRLDLSIRMNWQWGKVSLQPFFQIINATNHYNIFMYNYHLNPVSRDKDGNLIVGKPRRQGIIMFPILPTFGINFNF